MLSTAHGEENHGQWNRDDDDSKDDDDGDCTEAGGDIYLVLDPLPECGVNGLGVVGDRSEWRGHGGLICFDCSEDGIAGLHVAAGVFSLFD